MNKVISLIGIISLISITMLSVNEQVQARTIVGNYSDGYDTGKSQGRHDAENNNGYDSDCHNGADGSLAWCAGYKVGYGVGYVAQNAIEED